MTPRKVWSVLFILIGLFLIYNGCNKYYLADFIENEMKPIGQMVSNLGGNKYFDISHYDNLMENEKIYGVTGILLGILLAIIGTLLLREQTTGKAISFLDEEFDKQGDNRESEGKIWHL